jgi:hypothetical protein
MKIILFLLFTLLIYSNSYSQTIHKEDLKDFAAVLVTTPLNKPSNWQSDQDFVKNKPLEPQFHEYFIGQNPRELQSELPRWDGKSTSTFSIISIPNNQRFNFTLYIPEKRIQLVFFRNSQFEGGTNYLTIWKPKGDSLEFIHLSKTPIYSGNRIKGLRSDYMVNEAGDLYLTTEMSSGYDFYDGLEVAFYRLSKDYHLTELFNKYSQYTLPSIRSSDGFYEMFSYEFIHPHYLLMNSSKMSGSKIQDDQLGEYFDFKLDSTNSELINLSLKASDKNN